MTALLDADSVVRPVGRLGVMTIGSDTTRAEVVVTGDLDLASSVLLHAVLDSHLHAGRRFLRLNLAALESADAAGAAVLCEARDRSVAAHGGLVLVDVSCALGPVLAQHGLGAELLIHDEAHP